MVESIENDAARLQNLVIVRRRGGYCADHSIEAWPFRTAEFVILEIHVMNYFSDRSNRRILNLK